MDRRSLLKFMGCSTAFGLTASLLPRWALGFDRGTTFTPSSRDELGVARGLSYQILLSWEDELNSKGDKFGFNNDYNAFIPFPAKEDEAILWTNHEYANPLFVLGGADAEMRSVGGSLCHIKRWNGTWELAFDSVYNRRLDAFTKIPFAWHEPIDGSSFALGTFANCAGGVTPWATVLTCEENYQPAYGEYTYDAAGVKTLNYPGGGWRESYPRSPAHYGWVTEVNPLSGQAKKLVALGRFSHEGATTVLGPDGRTVVYMGDDTAGECIYKFIADKPRSLETGTLYVADSFAGRWIPLDVERDPRLKAAFGSQTELLIRTREAARIAGGTPQDRPEGIAIQPGTGAVFIALTNNKARKNSYGSLLKIEERDANPLALEFDVAVYKTGGPQSGFACPDNLAFDSKGNLWICSDISSDAIGKGDYGAFPNNGLFVVPVSGRRAGEVCQVASAPVEAEFTGPAFSADGSTLFLSVQHPGEESKPGEPFTSHWPEGEGRKPRTSVVTISGQLLADPGQYL